MFRIFANNRTCACDAFIGDGTALDLQENPIVQAYNLQITHLQSLVSLLNETVVELAMRSGKFGASCNANTDCLNGLGCNAFHVCGKLAGSSCSNPSHCSSGTCTANTCS
eukprot:TRINITY_DN5116_c0_g1_i2.p2 TRINITY_DN5116_c0_g1~~TRINITY_DN5116_c0_g1_i2.p2  ORF type:complete len:110 (+),score=40.48 TRINITY_DN5116_c0_g1_i2:178-507(+)